MRALPQTWFLTIATAQRRALLRSHEHASLLCKLAFDFRDEGRYLLHALVVMPDHVHTLLTPSYDHSVERCLQCIKGGFSQAIGKDSHPDAGVWQRGFREHRVRDAEDFVHKRSHIAQNPERWGLREHPYVHVSGPQLDAMPRHLRT